MTDELVQEPQAPQEPEKNPNFRWYILHAYSGFERKVKESLESRIQAFGLESRFGRIMIPTEPVTETVNGKKRTIERVFLPGYVLIEMELDNQIWHSACHGLPGNRRQAGGPERRGDQLAFEPLRGCQREAAAEDTV